MNAFFIEHLQESTTVNLIAKTLETSQFDKPLSNTVSGPVDCMQKFYCLYIFQTYFRETLINIDTEKSSY